MPASSSSCRILPIPCRRSADEGVALFYEGELARIIVEHVEQRTVGALTLDDLASYRAEVRDALQFEVGPWRVATNPAPAIGGVNLGAMLLTFGTDELVEWDAIAIRRLVKTQVAVGRYRHEHLDTAEDIPAAAGELLQLCRNGDLLRFAESGSTVHTSVVDRCGLACSITASSGYGSGEMPPGTGLWLNNCLGELELNLAGLDAAPPGRRLPSNMAPSIARSADQLLAFGSPGADRITTAMHQFCINFLQRKLDLKAAVVHPRLHVRLVGDVVDVAYEPGLDVDGLGYQVTPFADLSMYFGGVVAACQAGEDRVEVAADPRREGGTYVGP